MKRIKEIDVFEIKYLKHFYYKRLFNLDYFEDNARATEHLFARDTSNYISNS